MISDVIRSTQPMLLRGLAQHWPLVQAADFCAELRRYGERTPVGYWRGAPEIEGRFFYNADLSGFNFLREVRPFGDVLDELQAGTSDALYMGSTELDGSFPGLRAAFPMPELDAHEPLVSLWLGNRMRVPAHFDAPDNLACVVAGRRRFTLFPPEQLANLYVGPLDFTPAGQPISLVDLRAPDLDRFPRFAEAMEQARVFELEAGDALFIPSQWWHAVEGLDDINALINFWWRQSPAWMDTALNVLMYALLSLRELPPAQREAWRGLFEHYVFDAEAPTHIPEHARGVLGPLNEDIARQIRAVLLKRLNR